MVLKMLVVMVTMMLTVLVVMVTMMMPLFIHHDENGFIDNDSGIVRIT